VYYTTTCYPPAFYPDAVAFVEDNPQPDNLDESSQLSPATFGMTLCSNPVTSRAQFSISLPEAGAPQLTIVDLAGRVVQRMDCGVMQAGSNSITVDLSVPNGIYFIQLSEGEHIATQRLVVTD